MRNIDDVVLGNYLCKQSFKFRNICILRYMLKSGNILQDKIE